ncbi:MAG: hypothetical protein B7C24_13700 [Bacteroidetes bacterium 4572_77]|nr:MAG: hypothetical protein B7C24_13700 [Bacteroidetes bacterium 4572_77]
MIKKTIKKTSKKKKEEVIELKEIPTSIISVSREYQLNVNIIDPKTLDTLYTTVPEVSRAIDLRGAAIIYRGYEITPRNDSKEAEDFAGLCAYIVNKSGGVNFIEQWNKNTDNYGDGYIEIVEEGNEVTELAHVHPFQFGYELEIVIDPNTSMETTRIKLDKETQKPIGYATYKWNDTKGIFENDKKIPLEVIAHLKYKVIGDALYGVSLIQPMYGSILRKLQIEDSIEKAAKLVAAPKMVLSGNFDTEEDMRERAREAASLDINDVVLLDNGDTFQFVNPGSIQLPELREIFVTNITTASGIPRPVLTSESAEINKATLQELMRELRENMRSNMGKMQQVMEQQIFMRIGEVYGINDYHKIIPRFTFPEDTDTEEEIIVREEKKAATLTSLSNTLMLLNNMMMGTKNTPPNPDMKDKITTAMEGTFETFQDTLKTFNFDNDQGIEGIEEVDPEDVEPRQLHLDSHLSLPETMVQVEEIESSVQIIGSISQVTLIDDIETIRQPEVLRVRHEEMHFIYESLYNGAEIYDYETGSRITLEAIIIKHRQYIMLMEKIGVIHDMSEIASNLDQTI